MLLHPFRTTFRVYVAARFKINCNVNQSHQAESGPAQYDKEKLTRIYIVWMHSKLDNNSFGRTGEYILCSNLRYDMARCTVVLVDLL